MRLPLRKESARTGTLRLIEIEGLDLSACGGTHVGRTGCDRTGCAGLVGAIQGRAAHRIPLRRAARWDGFNGSATSQRHPSVSSRCCPPSYPLPSSGCRTTQRNRSGSSQRSRPTSRSTRRQRSRPARRSCLPVASSSRRSTATRCGSGPWRLRSPPTLESLQCWCPAPRQSSRSPRAPRISRCRATTSIGALVKEFGGRGGGKPDLAQCGGLQAAPEAVLASARARLMLTYVAAGL